MADVTLDTNAFNRALDQGVDPAALSKKNRLFITHVQRDELQATRSSQRLNDLLAVFTAVDQESVPTAAAVWGISRYGAAEWGDANGAYGDMLKRLNERNKSKANNAHDVLIAVTALKRGYLLVTDDRDLTAVMQDMGGHTCTFVEFLAMGAAALR